MREETPRVSWGMFFPDLRETARAASHSQSVESFACLAAGSILSDSDAWTNQQLTLIMERISYLDGSDSNDE